MRTQVRDGGKLSPVADAKPTAIGGGLIAFAVFEVLVARACCCIVRSRVCALHAGQRLIASVRDALWSKSVSLVRWLLHGVGGTGHWQHRAKELRCYRQEFCVVAFAPECCSMLLVSYGTRFTAQMRQ